MSNLDTRELIRSEAGRSRRQKVLSAHARLRRVDDDVWNTWGLKALKNASVNKISKPLMHTV